MLRVLGTAAVVALVTWLILLVTWYATVGRSSVPGVWDLR